VTLKLLLFAISIVIVVADVRAVISPRCPAVQVLAAASEIPLAAAIVSVSLLPLLFSVKVTLDPATSLPLR